MPLEYQKKNKRIGQKLMAWATANMCTYCMTEVMEERLGADGGAWRRGLVLEAWSRWRRVEERLGVDGGEAWSLRLL